MDCGSSRVPAGRGVHWLAVDVLVLVVCKLYVYCRITLVYGLASYVDQANQDVWLGVLCGPGNVFECGLASCVDRAYYYIHEKNKASKNKVL